jgi:hypothetical protein
MSPSLFSNVPSQGLFVAEELSCTILEENPLRRVPRAYSSRCGPSEECAPALDEADALLDVDL